MRRQTCLGGSWSPFLAWLIDIKHTNEILLLCSGAVHGGLKNRVTLFFITVKCSLDFGSGHFYIWGLIFWSIWVEFVFSVHDISLLICLSGPSLFSYKTFHLPQGVLLALYYCSSSAQIISTSFLNKQVAEPMPQTLLDSSGLYLAWERCGTLVSAAMDKVK